MNRQAAEQVGAARRAIAEQTAAARRVIARHGYTRPAYVTESTNGGALFYGFNFDTQKRVVGERFTERDGTLSVVVAIVRP